ncbi:MAG: hypothetical protein LBQ59_02635 [Candidatus Peribacteria bacterium]|jgi:hypothetical protein|nr:hypothetical protein [Candidatus Peribacteria bacterium]
MRNAIKTTNHKFTNFQAIRLTAENSIFIFACISERIEEFISCKIVKIEEIIIEIIAKFELYQGKKKAIRVDKTKINIHKINLKVITFQIILLESFGLFVISLIEIA